MKYSEFLQLNDILEKKEVSLSDFKSEKYIKRIFEADEETTASDNSDIKTEKGNIFTRWGKIKMTLNSQAKKLQQKILVDVVKKYMPNILQEERNIAQQIINTKKENKNPKEILNIVNKNLQASKAKRQKQLNIIENSVSEFIKNSQEAMNKKIDASNMNDKNKLNLKNYWLLLVTQIKLNAYTQMSKTISEDVKKVLGEDADTIKIYQALENDLKSIKTKQTESEQQVGKQKENIKKIDAEIKGESSSETKSENNVQYKVGGKYTFSKPDGKTAELTIIKIDGDNYTFKRDIGGYWKEFKTTKAWLDKNIKGKPTTQSNEYKVGGKYKFIQTNGKPAMLEITKIDGDNYTFKRDIGGYSKEFKTTKAWLDKNIKK